MWSTSEPYDTFIQLIYKFFPVSCLTLMDVPSGGCLSRARLAGVEESGARSALRCKLVEPVLFLGVKGEGFDIFALSKPCCGLRLEDPFERLEGGRAEEGWLAYRPLVSVSLLFFLVGVVPVME